MSDRKDTLELVRGGGNVFRDLKRPDADVEQTKSILAAQIIGVLEDEGLSTRKAQERTGINHSDFARIRKVKLDRFTIDRLMMILNRLGCHVEIRVNVERRPQAKEAAVHP
jgi:predicted XRE-type DNA-binding protein